MVDEYVLVVLEYSGQLAVFAQEKGAKTSDSVPRLQLLPITLLLLTHYTSTTRLTPCFLQLSPDRQESIKPVNSELV